MSQRRPTAPLPRSSARRGRARIALLLASLVSAAVLITGVLPPPPPPPAPVVDARLIARLSQSGFAVRADGAITQGLADQARAAAAASVRPITEPYRLGLVRFDAPGPEGGEPIRDAAAIIALIIAPAGQRFDIGSTKAVEIALFLDRVTLTPIVAVSLDALPPAPSPSVSPQPSPTPAP